ncbi:MAG: hypothetical protein NXI30_23610 [bacterium]|nr:hypothetical protein [bacterium]
MVSPERAIRNLLVDLEADESCTVTHGGICYDDLERYGWMMAAVDWMDEERATAPTWRTESGPCSNVEWPPAEDGKRVGLQGFGHDHEKYVRRDGRGYIAETRLERLRVDPL